MQVWRLWVATLVASIACTVPNPLDCSDGSCTDPTRPFCDTDGTIGGQQNTCVAVACTPDTFAECRDDVAVTCNHDGNNYNLVQCPLGCDAATGGCLACTDDSQCSGTSPVCDSNTKTCRPCVVDDDCASDVCDLDTGACIAEESIVYASPAGTDGNACSHTDPCSITRAVSVATTAAATPTIRLLPGTYAAQLAVTGPTPAPLVVVATGATVTTATPLSVTNGANTRLRGVMLVGSTDAVCGGTGQPTTTLEITDSAIVESANVAVFKATECNLTVDASTVSVTDGEILLEAGGDVTFRADRVHVHGPGELLILLSQTKDNVTFEDSLLEGVALQLNTTDATSPGSSVLLSFDTLINAPGNPLACSPKANFALTAENSIVVGAGSDDAVAGVSCTLNNTITFPQVAVAPGGLVEDPQFVSPTTGDFHLKPTSPAVDAVSSGTTSPALDLDGVSRPQGKSSDLGAFELKQP